MNVTENYLLKQMQTLAANMSAVPQSGSGKDKANEAGSFQDLMNQIGKAKDAAGEGPKDAGTKEADPLKEKVEEVKSEAVNVEDGEQEELKPEQLAANPNAVNLLDLFRPDVVQPAEEPVIEAPVDAIAEESVGAPDLALDGQMPEMETSVEANVDTSVPMEQQPESFQETMGEIPQEPQQQPAETAAETAGTVEEAPETAPGRLENTDKPREELPEVQAETGDEPKAEAAGTQQPVFHEPESAPVKVGETYETVDTEKPGMEAKLAGAIQTAVQNGAQKVEIHLAPQNLGSLTIEMTKDASGALQVVLHTSNAKAAGVLNQHMDGLQAALRGYSQEEVRIEVQRGGESQQQHFRHADPDGRGNQQRQQQEERREEKHSGDAFAQKLRLGLVSMDET